MSIWKNQRTVPVKTFQRPGRCSKTEQFAHPTNMHVKLELLLWETSPQHSYGTTSFSHHFGVNEVDLPNNPQSKFQVSYWVSVTFQGQTVKLSGGGKQLASTINPSQLQNSPKIPKPECFHNLGGGEKIPWSKNPTIFFGGTKNSPETGGKQSWTPRLSRISTSKAGWFPRVRITSTCDAVNPIQAVEPDHQIPQGGSNGKWLQIAKFWESWCEKMCWA